MAKTEKPKPGCFSGFLRVLLCAGNGTSPPVHPSNDNVAEQDETELLVHLKNDAMFDDTSTTPGLVARLMGLESLPNTNFVMKGATPDSVPRSRSVNFVDYMLNFDVGQGNHHRRVKTSASFREVPALAHRKKDNNDDLLVLCLDGDLSKEHEGGFDLRKLEMGLEELKLEELMKQGKKQGKKQGNKGKEVVRERNQGKSKKISKLKNEPRMVPSKNHGKKVRKQSDEKDLSSESQSSKSCGYRYSFGGGGSSSCSSSKLPKKEKKEFVESCHTTRMRKQEPSKKIESNCNSENLSPVSVLDINDYPSLYGANFADGTSPLASKSKCKSSSLMSVSDGAEDSASSDRGGACVYTDVNREAEYYSELMLKLHTLAEKDIREFDCSTKRIYECEEFEEICLSFEHKILDLLLHEVVNELAELSC